MLRSAAIALVLIVLGASARADDTLRLLPAPRGMVIGAGRLVLGKGLRIAVTSGTEEDRFAAGLLRDEIALANGTTPEVVNGRDGTIVLVRDPALQNLGDEGYRISVDARGARLTAATGAGLFYAVQTARQLVDPGGIPAVTIEDAPAIRWRGIHDDVSRGPMPTVATLERRISRASELKINLYILYLETAFAYAGQPLLASPGSALDSSDVRELVRFARDRHIALIPDQQTTSHMERVLRSESYQALAEVPHGATLAPEAPAYAFVGSMVDELARVFPGPYVQLGGDESAWGEGRSRERIARDGIGGVFAEHARALGEIARSHDRRLILWGDVVVEHPEIAAHLPEGVTFATWCYQDLDDYSRWIRQFATARRDFFVCPSAANWNRVFPNVDLSLSNIRKFVAQGRAAGAQGAVICAWADNGEAPFDLNWYALAGAAAASWQSAELDTAALRTRFDWFLLRSREPRVADAVGRLQAIHRVVQGARRYDASLELFWEHPLGTPTDNDVLAALAPASASMRLLSETALTEIAQVRASTRRSVETLDALDFAARRLLALGLRARIAADVPVRYRELLYAESRRNDADFLKALREIQAELEEGKEASVELREQQERLWLEEDRPYWLGNVLARYDHDIGIWEERIDGFRRCLAEARLGRPLPAAQTLGFNP